LTERAVQEFDAAGMKLDRYRALLNLENYQRQLGADDDAARTFADAHRLVHELAVERLDEEHYERYPDRVREIERNTYRKLEEEGVEASGLDIGISAFLGDRLAQEADRHYERAEYEAAEHALLQSLAHWQHLDALHVLPRVHQALGLLYGEVGQRQRALEHLVLARQAAHAVGDAFREMLACGNLCRLVIRGDGSFGLDALELISQARALRPIAVRQRFADAVEGAELPADLALDGGVIDTLDATICVSRGAPDLAEQALRRSVELAEGVAESEDEDDKLVRYRLALRLVKLHGVLRAQGKDSEAKEIAARLDLVASADENPRTAFAVNSELGMDRFGRGELTLETLGRLQASCDAYERLRREALALGELDEYPGLLAPPFDEAVEVALHLQLLDEALHLLERSKSRSLLDALRARSGPPVEEGPLADEARLWQQLQDAHAEFDRGAAGEESADRARRLYRAAERIEELQEQLEQVWRGLETTHPDVIAHRLAQPATRGQLTRALAERDDDALLVEFFLGPRSVQALTLDETGDLVAHRIADAQAGPWEDLERLVRESGDRAGGMALEALRHPALRTLASFVDTVAGDRPALLVPHRFLHALPLHLLGADDDALAARPRTYHLPSASLLRYVAADSTKSRATVVGGDPLTDLDFATLEADAVAAHFGIAAATGAACSRAWLGAQLSNGHAPLRLVHLACHAIFHPRRAERSGLVLAAGDGGADLLSVRDIATLDWSADVVVLSACSSGQQQVRDGDELAGLSRALLAQGARALIVALWEVPDLATYLLVERLYERLPSDRQWTIEEVGTALAGAQKAVRDLTARDLLYVAADLHAAGQSAGADHVSRAAMAATAIAHRAAGNRDEWLRWREALVCLRDGRPPAPDIGAPDWAAQPHIARGSEYDIAPFAEPVHWAAFALSGCG
jgi:CHAT domain-containing protein